VSQINTPIPVANRVHSFSYAIRNIAIEAQKVEASGKTVRYLNVGNPPAFGFQPPAHLIAAVERAMHDGHNGYGPSAGVEPARTAIANEYASRGWRTSANRVFVTAGTSEGIDMAISAIVDEGDEVLVPLPTYPLYTAVLAKLGGRAVYYRMDPDRGWAPDLDHLASLVGPATRALVVIDPNNPTGATYPPSVRRALIDFSERHGLIMLADEVYGDLGFEGPVPPMGSLAPDAAIVSLSSLSKGYLAPGWRTGWLAVGRSPRLDDVVAALGKLADGRLCSTVPMQYAIISALTGDRSHQTSFRAALRERAKVATEGLNSIDGITCTQPNAAFYAMPRVALPRGRTDEQYVIALLRATGVLVVHGSGFGMSPGDGYFRLVFLASPDELRDVVRLMNDFTREYLR
jgi:aspartate/methionine/tyrosine aminotransferase